MMSQINIHFKTWLLTFLLVTSSSYAYGLNKDISGNFDVGGIKIHIEYYSQKSPSIIVQSGYNGYSSE